MKKIPLVSSEITGLWNSYMSNTMIVCVLKHFLSNVEDNEIRNILQHTLDVSNNHLIEATNLFNEEKLPIPDGFTDNDVNINAPRLFSDAFYLQYLGYMSRVGMQSYSLILNQIARADIREYITKRIYENVELYNSSAELRLSQGTFIRAPQVEVPKEITYIKSQSFITDMFGEKRPLLTREITHIFSIIFSNIIGRVISTGFGQVSKEKKHYDYMFEGKNLATKQIGSLTSLLTDEAIPIPSSSWSHVTDSTVAPFSDKLMLNHQIILCSSALSNLGMAIADTMRTDLQAKYAGFTSNIMTYAKNGADILIDRGELEQPPQAIKHENLV
jgi:hypothetical protein